jgi:hypothetical protein
MSRSDQPRLFQATVFLPGRFEDGRFTSPHLPPEAKVGRGGLAFARPERLVGERMFTHWPRTNGAGEIIALTLAGCVSEPPEHAVHVQGILLRATNHTLTFLIEPRRQKFEPFRLYLKRAPELTERLELNKPYRIEGRLEGMQLVAERAFPLDWSEILKRRKLRTELPPVEEKSAKPSGKKKGASSPAPETDAPPPARKRVGLPPTTKTPAPPPPSQKPAPPPPPPVELPPALNKGEQIGVTGTGPYYLVVSAPVVNTWWPKLERMLPRLPPPHKVRTYSDGSRAVVSSNLHALTAWFKQVRKSREEAA